MRIEKMYRRICEGLNTKGKLIPANDDVYNHINNLKKDHYLSIYLYNEEQKEKFYAEIEKIKDGKVIKTINGAKGINDVITDKIVFDFDHESDLNKAKADTLETVKRLEKLGIDPSDMCITFSGNKGFGIELQTKELFNPDEAKNIAKGIAGDLETFDPKVYNASRVFRIPFTKHQTSGLFKMPISPSELEEDISEIVDIAKEEYEPEPVGKPVELSESVLKFKEKKNTEEKRVYEGEVADLDFKNKPRWLSNWKYALQEGFFPEGIRNHSLMILCATYRGQGFNKLTAYRMLKGAAELQHQRTGQERYADEQIWLEIVEQVYDQGWKGGTYSEDNFEDDLVEYLEEIGVPRSKPEDDENPLLATNDVFGVFENFAENIEKNTIKTGIAELDRLCRITTSMLVGMLGCPGCHRKGTKILMFDGTTKNVEDVRVGELLMGPDSKPREVLKLRQGEDQMVQINPLRSESFVVNMHHILNLRQSKTNLTKSIPCDLNITVKDYIQGIENGSSLLSGYRLHKTGVNFGEKDLPIDPYYLGLWLGDGNSDSASITTMDEEIVSYLEEFAKTRNLNFSVGEKCGKANVYRITKDASEFSNNVVQDLKELEVYKNKHIPQIYLTSSRDQRCRLLAGLIDSDGTLEANGCGWEITQKSDQLAKGIQYLSRSLGFHCSMNKVTKSCVYKGERREGEYFRLYISGLEEILDVPVRLEHRKIKRVMKSKDPSNYGFSYEILGKEDYYGFTLDEDHLYLTDDYFVHHNSGKTATTLNILENHSNGGETSIFFSFDMGKPLVYQKLVQKQTGKNSDEVFKIFVDKNEQEKEKIKYKVNKAYENVQMCFKTGASVDNMRQYIMEYEQRTGKKVRMIAVDYLEKLVGPFTDATANSGYNAAKLQELCNDLELCCLLLLQPQKMAGDPSDPLLTYRRVKGASVIEQDCRVIFSIFREGYHPQSYEEDEFITYAVLKNTMGTLGQVDCYWDGQTGDVDEIDDEGREVLKKLRKRKAEKKAMEDL